MERVLRPGDDVFGRYGLHTGVIAGVLALDAQRTASGRRHPTIGPTPATAAPIQCFFRFQHTMPLTPCLLHMSADTDTACVSLSEPRRAIAPGQFAVFYMYDTRTDQYELFASAVIMKPGPSLYDRGERVLVLERAHGAERVVRICTA